MKSRETCPWCGKYHDERIADVIRPLEEAHGKLTTVHTPRGAWRVPRTTSGCTALPLTNFPRWPRNTAGNAQEGSRELEPSAPVIAVGRVIWLRDESTKTLRRRT